MDEGPDMWRWGCEKVMGWEFPGLECDDQWTSSIMNIDTNGFNI